MAGCAVCDSQSLSATAWLLLTDNILDSPITNQWIMSEAVSGIHNVSRYEVSGNVSLSDTQCTLYEIIILDKNVSSSSRVLLCDGSSAHLIRVWTRLCWDGTVLLEGHHETLESFSCLCERTDETYNPKQPWHLKFPLWRWEKCDVSCFCPCSHQLPQRHGEDRQARLHPHTARCAAHPSEDHRHCGNAFHLQGPAL